MRKISKSDKSPMLIGITGGIGSGKSTAASYLSRLGAYLIDADEISHEILRFGQAAYYEVINEFGEDILSDDKSIDRKVLAAVAFSDREKLCALNRITHKYIFEEMERLIDRYAEERKYDMIILDVPLLFDDDFPIKCDRTVAVVADTEVRLRRAASRDKMPIGKIKDRARAQISDERLRELADYTIDNSGDQNSFENRLRMFYKELKQENLE